MGMLPDIGYPQTGEAVDAGVYACLNCPHDSEDDNSVAYLSKRKNLPECPVSGYTYWMKIT